MKRSAAPRKNQHMTPSLSRAARAVLNWSMSDLAERASVAPTTIRDYENGSREPHRLTRDAIARVFWEEGIEFVGGKNQQPGLLVHRPDLLNNPPPQREKRSKK
jgi:transcriptional regulator with XRE-family HTH domain